MSNQDSNRELLAAYTVLDVDYKNAALRYVAGEAAGTTLDISSNAIDAPATAVGVPSVAVGADDDPDPELFSFTVPVTGGDPQVRILLVKVSTAGGTSTGRYSVLDPHDPPSGTWTTLARDVYLKYNNADVAGNPHAVAQAGNTLYIIEYDTQKIWPLGIHDLDGKITTPAAVATYSFNTFIDLGPGSGANLPADAKGQDLIYLKNGNDEYLLALYQVPTNPSATAYANSILVRLKKNATSGLFAYLDQAEVGRNAQSIIPVSYTPSEATDPVTMLLIPAIGGSQNDGSTNGTDSNIYKADPFADAGDFTAEEILTGDSMPSSGVPGTFDIAAIAAQAANNGIVYILTYTFATGWTALYWKLYKTAADQLLALTGSPTLSQLEIQTEGVTDPARILTIADHGPTSGIQGYGGLSFWDILYENGIVAAGDRLWFRKDGILINGAQTYGTSPRVFTPGLGFGQTGGDNINSFDLVAETIRQSKAGVSLKRGFKSVKFQGAAEEEDEK
jgi:hypothetical protein